MMGDDLPQPELDSDEEFLRRGKDPVRPTSSDRTGRVDETETADPTPARLPRRVTIEGYDIIRELHRGGQGIVYEAVQKSTKRKVAIKVLLEGGFASSSARRRFQREITLAAGLKHPNIIAIFDSGETPDGHQFCVMDYVRGRSIRDYVRENKVPLEDTLKLFSSVCEAAYFANQKGVVHRDLKPSNILVDTDGVPRVLDFGLAKQLAGGTESLVSMTGQVMGTLQYMSPEQTRGNPDEIDARSDVYSLGVILYELLTGTHPYPTKGDMLSVVKHITETEPTPPSKVWCPESGVTGRKSRRFRAGPCPIDNELQTIVFKALSKSRERRYPSADALRQDISSYLRGDPIEAKRDSSLYVLKKSLRRHRVGIAVTIGFVAVAVLALYVGSRTGTREAPAPALTGPITSLAVLPLANLSGDPDQEFFADGMTGELITALGKIRALKVISRRSVMGYKDTEKSSADIARELNVDALVEGTVTRFGNRVRIAANLIRAATSEQLWGDSYERDLSDVLAMQGAIARAIADEIQAKVTPQEQQRLTSAPSVNPDAYHAYLRGMQHAEGPAWESENECQLAVQMFERAVKLDPGFALAHARLSMAHSAIHHYGFDRTEARAAKSKAAADRAMELQPDLAEAHMALGWYHYYCHRDYDPALEEFSIAVKDLSNDALLWDGMASAHRRRGGFEEGLNEFRRAFELRPRDGYLAKEVALTYMDMRRYPDALRLTARSVSLSPDQNQAYLSSAAVHWLWNGDLKSARTSLEAIPKSLTPPDPVQWHWIRQELLERDYQAVLDRLTFKSSNSFVAQEWFLAKAQLAGFVYQLMGEPERARTSYDAARIVLEREVQERPSDDRVRSSLGIVYAGMGRIEEAIREGTLGVELVPVSKDALIGPSRVKDLAFIYTLVGKYDAALDEIEHLLSIPSRFSVPLLLLDPRWDPLRDHPRYKDLLRRHGFEPEPQSQSTAKPPDDKIMLAVLPFENLGPAEDEYFADGISDEIRSRLAAVRKLGVISRSSAFQYKVSDKTNRQIGSELGVDYLISGTIRWDKRGGGTGRVRITPELIRISDDLSLWSQPYNRVLEDIFEVQSDIAGQVIKQLKITLLEPERQAIEARPTENPDAYHAYLRGLDYRGRPDESKEDLSFAVQMFKRAVSIDPDFAIAYAELSMVQSLIHHMGYDRTEVRAAKAKVAVDRALELQPELSEASLAMGWYHYWCHRDYDRALEAFDIAEKGLPNDARILGGVGAIRRRQGRLEAALGYFKRASELSPIDANLTTNIAETYILLRRYSDGVYWCDRSISLAPDQVFAYVEKARNHWLWHGDIEKARSTFEEMPRKNTSRSIFHWFQQELFERKYQAALDRLAFRPGESLEYQFWFIPKSQLAGLVYRLMGEPERSRKAYETARILLEEEIEKRAEDHRVRSSLGIVYAGLGRKEDAIREGKLGVELFPVSKDAMIGPSRVEDLAFIYTLVGEHDDALDQIEYLLSIPSKTMSVPMLRLDPRWDPLRDHPRYKDLLRRHGFEPEP